MSRKSKINPIEKVIKISSVITRLTIQNLLFFIVLLTGQHTASPKRQISVILFVRPKESRSTQLRQFLCISAKV